MPYFDHNATTPLCEPARDALLEALDRHWHNPSSLYRDAGAANIRLNDCRRAIAEFLDCESEQIVFNSGATEANNAVLRHFDSAGNRLAISAIEHPCVHEPARQLFGEGCLELRAGGDGAVAAELPDGEFSLVSVMAANNETGVLQPWRELAAVCRERGVPFHCDAVQWIGKLPVDGLGKCDFVTASAHKFGGPKGVGFLKLPTADYRFRSQLGGPQESGHRGGTENYPAVAAMTAALLASTSGSAEGRDGFEARLAETLPGVEFIGQSAPRLWNTSMLLVPRHENIRWLTRVDRLGFQISTGSACASGKEGPSTTLAAMGYGLDAMKRALRVSSGPQTTLDEWLALADALVETSNDLESKSDRTLRKPTTSLLGPS